MQLRIQHETYAPTEKQSSRLVVLLHDLEVRDRLVQSRINKFLYQYSTESMPRQSQSNMVSSTERTWHRQRRGESSSGVWWEGVGGRRGSLMRDSQCEMNGVQNAKMQE